jgi:hypothetical protein
MKLPLALTVIILAAGSFWGVREHSALTTLRERHRQVVDEAAALGVSTDAAKPFSPTKASKREREDSTLKVRDFSDKLVAFAKQMEEMEKSGEQPDQEQQKRIMDIIDGMLSLNGDELKILIAELRGRSDISDEMRKNMIGFSIIMLAQQHPQTALALFTESSDLMEDNPMSEHVLSSALTQWAKDQPLAAVEWIKKNSGKHKELVTEEAKRAVIAGAAKNDFSLAFQLADELMPGVNDGSTLSAMLQSAETPERKAELLAAIRKQASSIKDKAESDKFLKSGTMRLFSKVSGSGFDKTMNWLKTANLSEDDAINLAEGLHYEHTKADTGKWLDWMAARSADGNKNESATRNLVRNWTEQDYKAAGEWLAKSHAGPLKETATLSYLETVAPYDPEVATQWAGTLPADKQAAAMMNIHEALQQKDKAAAEEFAKRHGIKSR